MADPTREEVERVFVEASVLDPDDGEAGIVEVYSGRVLGRFRSLRAAKRDLSNDPQKWIGRAVAAKLRGEG